MTSLTVINGVGDTAVIWSCYPNGIIVWHSDFLVFLTYYKSVPCYCQLLYCYRHCDHSHKHVRSYSLRATRI